MWALLLLYICQPPGWIVDFHLFRYRISAFTHVPLIPTFILGDLILFYLLSRPSLPYAFISPFGPFVDILFAPHHILHFPQIIWNLTRTFSLPRHVSLFSLPAHTIHTFSPTHATSTHHTRLYAPARISFALMIYVAFLLHTSFAFAPTCFTHHIPVVLLLTLLRCDLIFYGCPLCPDVPSHLHHFTFPTPTALPHLTCLYTTHTIPYTPSCPFASHVALR